MVVPLAYTSVQADTRGATAATLVILHTAPIAGPTRRPAIVIDASGEIMRSQINGGNGSAYMKCRMRSELLNLATPGAYLLPALLSGFLGRFLGSLFHGFLRGLGPLGSLLFVGDFLFAARAGPISPRPPSPIPDRSRQGRLLISSSMSRIVSNIPIMPGARCNDGVERVPFADDAVRPWTRAEQGEFPHAGKTRHPQPCARR